MILTHNHPSGKPDSSHADISITQSLKDALALVDVRGLDHILVGAEGSYSLAEHGKL